MAGVVLAAGLAALPVLAQEAAKRAAETGAGPSEAALEHGMTSAGS